MEITDDFLRILSSELAKFYYKKNEVEKFYLLFDSIQKYEQEGEKRDQTVAYYNALHHWRNENPEMDIEDLKKLLIKNKFNLKMLHFESSFSSSYSPLKNKIKKSIPKISKINDEIETEKIIESTQASQTKTFMQKTKRAPSQLHLLIQNGQIKLVKLMIEKGENVDEIDSVYNSTPLYVASLYGRLEIIQFLLEKKANMFITNQNNWSPLHPAAQEGFIEIADILLKHGADVNSLSEDLLTPLYMAGRHEKFEMVKFLLENGAKIELRTSAKITVLHIAAQKGFTQIMKILLEKAVREGIIDIIDELDQDCNKSCLYLGSYYGHFEIVKMLVKYGAKVNLPVVDDWTSLHSAAEQGHENITEFLIENGANVNAKSIHGVTPLYQAAQNGHFEIVKLLVQNGANVDEKCTDDWTAFLVATNNGHDEIGEFLINFKLD